MSFLIAASIYLHALTLVSAKPPMTDTPPVNHALLFRWPSPSDATVTQTRTMDNKTMVATYHLHYVLNSDETSDVGLTDAKIVAIDGKIPDEQMRLALGPISALLVPPDMHIQAGGQHPELLNESKYYDDILKIMSAKYHGEEAEGMKMSSPAQPFVSRGTTS